MKIRPGIFRSMTYHDHVRHPPKFLDTNLCLLSNVGHRVRLAGAFLVWHQQSGKQLEVKIVVGKDHAVVRSAALGWPVHVAVEEVDRRRAEGRFDVVVVLAQDVGDLGGVGVVVFIEHKSVQVAALFLNRNRSCKLQ